jgi:hypothetical protein
MRQELLLLLLLFLFCTLINVYTMWTYYEKTILNFLFLCFSVWLSIGKFLNSFLSSSLFLSFVFHPFDEPFLPFSNHVSFFTKQREHAGSRSLWCSTSLTSQGRHSPLLAAVFHREPSWKQCRQGFKSKSLLFLVNAGIARQGFESHVVFVSSQPT